jgi:tetratricopeptide (TPR) repeat protein
MVRSSRLILFILCLQLLSVAQVRDRRGAGPAGASRPRLGQAGSQQELDDYNRLHNEVDPAVKKTLIDEFVEKYPRSGLLAYVYQDGVYLGRQANNIEMMAEYGEKSLVLWPDNYTLLTELGSAYAQRNRVDLAEARASQALEMVAAADKPQHMTAQQWAEGRKMLMSSNYNTLGYVHVRRAQASQDEAVRRREAESAIAPFRRALEYVPIDDFTLYGLGYAYTILNDYPNAESNLAKAVAVNGIVMASAHRLLEEVYKSRHKQSLEGLDEVIARAKAELGTY